MARLARSLLLAALSLSLASCYFAQSRARPIPALAVIREPGIRQDCLVIFVPGMFDGPDTYLDHGFPQTLLQSGAECDSVAVNLHVGYYAEPGIADLLYEDVLAPAAARGYDEIGLEGISMGGLGASLLMREHPELVDGVILLSPYLGEESVVREITEAGGLEAWHPPDPMPVAMTESNYTTHLWAFLRGYVDDPDGMPALYLGHANGERLEPAAQLLSAVLPEGRVAAVDGAHNWATWGPLFRGFLQAARPGRGGSLARAGD